MLQNLDLNRMRVFLSVFINRSVTVAGSHLNISPSAVSQSIRALERDLNVRLFQRINKKLIPTAEAQELSYLVQRFLEGVGNWKGQALSKRKELSGTLRIGAPPELGSHRLGSALTAFSKKPFVNFRIELGLPDRLMERLVLGHLDLALCDNGPYIKKYKSSALWKTVFEEEAILVCSNSFSSSHLGKDHGYENLITLPHIDYREDGKVLALWYKHHFSKTPNNLNLRFVTSHVNGVIAAVKAGFGLAFVPTYLIEEDLKRGRLVKVKTGRPDYVNSIFLVQMKDKVPSPLEREVIKVLEGSF